MIRDVVGGKVASYWLNAAVDAQIAEFLLSYVRGGDLPADDSPAARRARNLVQRTPADRHRQRVVVRAYTERHLNGHADMVLAGHLDRVLNINLIDEIAPWTEDDISLRGLFFPWLRLYLNDFEHLRAYARHEAGIDLILDRAAIIEEIAAVQRANIAVNGANRLHLDGSSDDLSEAQLSDKVQRLRHLARQYEHPDRFLKAAARTQQAASRWDWLFMQTLRLRYGLPFRPEK